MNVRSGFWLLLLALAVAGCGQARSAPSHVTPQPPTKMLEPGQTYVPVDAALEASLPGKIRGVPYLAYGLRGDSQGCYDIWAYGFCTGELDALADETGVPRSRMAVAVAWPTGDGSVFVRAIRVPGSQAPLGTAWVAAVRRSLFGGIEPVVENLPIGGKVVQHIRGENRGSFDHDQYAYVAGDVVYVLVDIPSTPAGGTQEPACPTCLEEAFAQLP